MNIPDQDDGPAFGDGQRLGRAWALRAATGGEVRRMLAGSLDPAELADWKSWADLAVVEHATQFRAGFVLGVREVVAHIREVRDGTSPWMYEAVQPDWHGVLLRLLAVLDGGDPSAVGRQQPAEASLRRERHRGVTNSGPSAATVRPLSS